jgi:hypothetical protein
MKHGSSRDNEACHLETAERSLRSGLAAFEIKIKIKST